MSMSLTSPYVLSLPQLGCESPPLTGAVLPVLDTLLNITLADNVQIANISLQHTAWRLPSDAAAPILSPAAPRPRRLRGSGPLPVPTAAVRAHGARGLSLSGVVLARLGADGVWADDCNGTLLARSRVADVGAAAVRLDGAAGARIEDVFFAGVGATWQQGAAVVAGHSSNVSVVHATAANVTSDAFVFEVVSGSELGFSRVSGGGSNTSNETISDWGAFHTALPNSTVPALHAHDNVFAFLARLGTVLVLQCWLE